MMTRTVVLVAVTGIALACGGATSNGSSGTNLCASVVCAALDACHVAGTCNSATGTCSNPAAQNGTTCPGGTCQSGSCAAASALCAGVVCTALDACHVAGTCNSATGTCSHPVAQDGTTCPGGTCRAGTCVATSALCAGVVCEALDACHPAGSCDPASGACVAEPAADGAACTGGICSGGVCVAADGSRCTDGIRNGTETGVDCGGSLCPACVNGQTCGTDTDCLSGWCSAGSCARRVTALVADPGADRQVDGGVRVVLDGTRSRSPTGAIKTWSWVQTAGPPVALTGADTAHPAFDAPAADGTGPALAFTLTVDDGVATAMAPLAVRIRSANHPPEDTSLGLVLNAMNEGRVDRDTAMTYLAYSTVGDPRLPAEFRGTRQPTSGTSALHIMGEEFPNLSPSGQAAVFPLLLPPAAPGSPDSLATARAATAGATRSSRAVVHAPGWTGVSSQHLVIWFKASQVNGLATATRLSREAESVIWPKLEAVFTRAHMPVLDDGAINLVNGGVHGKLNVYLTPLPPGMYGEEMSYRNPPSPSWISIRADLPFSGKPGGLAESLAHEMTHACQDSYHQSQSYQGHRWIFEGTATWAEDYVYPTNNTEQEYAPKLLEFPDSGIGDEWSTRPYSTYLFFQYVTRSMQDDDFIERVFSRFEGEDALSAVDGALPYGVGMEFQWGAFVRAAWNHDPGQGFWGLDGLQVKAKPVALTELRMGTPQFFLNDISLPELSAQYWQFSLPDPTVRQIYFYDGLSFALEWKDLPEGRVLLVSDSWTPDEDRFPHTYTGVLTRRLESWAPLQVPAPGAMLLCQDDPAERVDGFTLMFGNSQHKAGDRLMKQGPVPPMLLLSNIGCFEWSGTVTGVTSPGSGGPQERTTATVAWERNEIGKLTGQAMFSVRSVSATWEVSGTVDRCTYKGSDSWTDSGSSAGQLVFSPTFVSGRLNRGYTATVGGHDVTYTATCTDESGTTTVTTHRKTVNVLNTQNRSDPDWVPQVAADGLHASGTADDGDMVYSWSFTSTPGP